MLTDTKAHVATGPVTNAKLWWLKVDGLLPAGVVGASQISRSRHELWNVVVDGLQDRLGKLTGSNGLVGWLVGWEGLLPALWKHTGETAGQVSVRILVLLAVLLEKLVPLLLSSGTGGRGLVALVVNLLWDDEALLWVETELLLDHLAVVLLERVTVDTTSTLKLGTETNGGGKLDHGWLVGDLLGLLDGSLHTLEIGVTLLDVLNVPAVSLETLHNILGEGTLGVTVDRNVVVVVDGDQFTELQVTGHGSGLGGNTLHSATITEEGVGEVVDELETWLVEGGGGVSLGNGKTNSVGETLTKRTSGDLDTWGVVALWVTWCDAVELLRKMSEAKLVRRAINTYTERLKVVNADLVAVQVVDSILEHASVTVTVSKSASGNIYPCAMAREAHILNIWQPGGACLVAKYRPMPARSSFPPP